MTTLDKNKREIADFLNEYVKSNGTQKIMSNSEIKALLGTAGISLYTMTQFPDMCYNRTNYANLGSFADDILLFVYEGRDQFRIVGEQYPYTGEIIRKVKKTGEEIILGEWVNGELVSWNAGKPVDSKHFTAELNDEFNEINEIIDEAGQIGLDKMATAKVRVNQSLFRNRLLCRYQKCCISGCGVSEKQLLLASHIKPWCEAEPDERTNVNNGLLLCPNHDKLFDEKWISFDDNGHIIISDRLSANDQIFMNVNPNMSITVTEQMKPFLKHHRDAFVNIL